MSKVMKGKSSRLKQMIISMVRRLSRPKCMEIRMVLSKKNNFSIAAISAKIDGMFCYHAIEDDDDVDHLSKPIVLHSNNMAGCSVQEFDGRDDDKYPDLRHTLFDELAELLDDPNSLVSAIDMVKNAKEEGESFNLEDEIDEVADLLIIKFHKRMRLQKLLSFKRNQQMLQTSA